ncbi:hypothetical protein ZWY2020_014476 [Hordeum vulgare]|nr:hypothetical protein ZWY2020_014476 [Hordeum vulgare]
MELAVGAMGSLLPKLGELLEEQYKLQKSVKSDFQYLQRELQSMHAALSEVAEVPREQLKQQDRLWATDVRELSQDIEDVVDNFLVRIEGPKSEPAANPDCLRGLIVNMTKLKKWKARRQIAAAIKDIKEQVHEVANRDGRYRGPHGVVSHLTAIAATRVTTTVDPVLIALYGDQKKLIAISDAKDEIIKKLSEGDDVSMKHLKILSVVGFGGLGKTTLAKAVYDELRGQFGSWAFVTVSQNPDVRKVLRDLLYQLDNEKYKDLGGAILFMAETELIEKLQESLRTKRYFIVIDDLWDVKVWDTIRYALVDSNQGSRIITTTRNRDVSKACCSFNDDIIYNMKPLSETNSQILFHKRIFASDTGCPRELEQVSKDILKKCGGVPLAIITIASHLAGDQQIKPMDQWYSLLNSIGRGLTRGGDVEEMRRILSLSYYDLPYRLRTCLLHLSIFPEDTEISKGRLIKRWIAEGLFQGENHEASLFDLGESYFNTLINRSMIEPVGISVEGRARACRVHDMMLDLICDLSSEENFVTVLDVIKGDTPLERKIRRMSLQKSMENLATIWLDSASMSQVRSFTIFSPASNQMLCLSRFQVLRVLDLEGCCLGESWHLNLRHIGKLLHLRYLGLRGTQAHELPMEIGMLKFLQTLDLRGTWAELPSSVVGLEHLIFLHLSLVMELPIGLRNLTSLEELTGVHVGSFCAKIVKELGYLTKLRVLDINWRGSEKNREDRDLADFLCSLHNLQNLEIRGGDDHVYLRRDWVPSPHLRRLVLHGWLQELPTWLSTSSLPLLSYLDINVRQVLSKDIQTVGMLKSLHFVSLKTGTGQCDVERLVLSADAFPCARHCFFINVIMVPSSFARGAMPMVKSLRFGVRVLDILTGDLDLSLKNLPSLEEVIIDYDESKARRHECIQARDMLSHALEEHPNCPTIDTGHNWGRGKGIVQGEGSEPSMRSRTQLTGDGVVSLDSIVQASISPHGAFNRFSSMFSSFLVKMKLEITLILSTHVDDIV